MNAPRLGALITLPLLVAGSACTTGTRARPAATAPHASVVATVSIGEGPILLAIAPDGANVYAASSGALSTIDTATNTVVGSLRTGPYPAGIAVAPDGRRVYLTNVFSTSLTVADPAASKLLESIDLVLQRYRGGYGRIGLTPDGTTAYLPNQVNEFFAFVRPSTGAIDTTLLGIRPVDVAITPDGRTAYVCGCASFCRNGTVQVLETASKRTLGQITVGPSPYRIAISRDGRRAYTANLAGPSVSVIDVASGSVLATVPVAVEPTGLAVSADGGSVYVTSLVSGELTVIDAQTSTVRAVARVGDAAREVVLTPDGRRAYVSVKTTVVVVDTDSLPHPAG